jgi:hypothetical protein
MTTTQKHFIELASIGDTAASVFLECDTATPAYWQRTDKGNLAPVGEGKAKQLNRVLGPPYAPPRPPRSRTKNPIRAAMKADEKARAFKNRPKTPIGGNEF